MDWKEVLSGLSDSLPAGEETPGVPEGATEKPKPGGKLHIAVEKKGRKGKTATIIYGFTCEDAELQKTATRLKQSLGIGGSARCGEILLQGEVRERAAEILRSLGYRI